jgi:hypothetical protein
MTHRKTTFVLGLAACVVLAGAALARQSQLSLSGRVVLEAQKQRRAAPTPRLTARLYFPKEENRPTLVTYTDAGGNFKFSDLSAGRYLLEIYQGSDMVFQKVLTIDEGLAQPVVITLKLRA